MKYNGQKKSERSITDFLQELTFNLDILMYVRCHSDVLRPYQFVIQTDLELQQLLLRVLVIMIAACSAEVCEAISLYQLQTCANHSQC